MDGRIPWLDTLPKHSVGAEIGVMRGDFSSHMVRIVEPKLLYLVDLWSPEPYKIAPSGCAVWKKDRRHLYNLRLAMQNHSEAMAKGIVRVICCDSAKAAEFVPDESVDWVYIDAGHSLEQALADLEAWYPKLVSGGILAGDDYDNNCGVPAAVELFNEDKGLQIELLTGGRVNNFSMRKP